MFDVEFSSNAKKFLNKSEKNIAKRIINEVEKLKENKIYCVNCDEEMKLTILKNYEFEDGILLKNVLCYKCKDCEELFFTEEQSKIMEKITNQLKQNLFSFRKKITISGKSLVLNIPIELAEHLNLKQGTEVKILPTLKDGFIVKIET